MKRSLFVCATLYAITLILPTSCFADIVVFDGLPGNARAEWESVANANAAEDFADLTFHPRLSVATDNGSVGSGNWNDTVTDAGAVTTWSFENGIVSWGADFNLLIPGGPETGLSITLTYKDSSTETIGVVPATHGVAVTFWGFTSDVVVTDITFATAASLLTEESYTMDSMSFRSVPEPASLALLSILAIVSTLPRRRR